MKNLTLLLAALFLGTVGSFAESRNETVATNTITAYGNPFIFVEDGVTFSVYPDGEFDFYINNQVEVGAGVNFGTTSITFNSGYNYNPYVQYDDYGAVVQVENVAVYYDYYGRVNQLGNVNIWYQNGRIHRVGGMYVYYNGGVFSHYTGYVNIYNRHYVYLPYHRYFIRPAVGFCLVYNRPYRRYYAPVRYTYYGPYAYNSRVTYARIGNTYRYNKSHNREQIYRNDRRVAMREDGRRSTSAPARSANTTAVRTNRTVTRSSNVSSSKPVVAQRTEVRSNTTQSKAATRETRSAPREAQRSVTQRSVTRSTPNRTVKRSTVSSSRSVSRNSDAKKSTRSAVNKTPARSGRSSQVARSNNKRTIVQ